MDTQIYDPNPLSYFNGPTDFGNQLGKAIATRINEAYVPDASNRMTFGSYPTSSFTNQALGGQNYVVQPDLYQQALSGYGTQGLGGYPTMSFNSFLIMVLSQDNNHATITHAVATSFVTHILAPQLRKQYLRKLRAAAPTAS
ncbi:hypothetical protein OSTOST_22822 [Ostertagia ostertagi]